MTPSSYHTHTTFCDGKDSPEELVLEAIRLGCPEIGFSGHAHTAFDESWCMSVGGTKEYIDCINSLKTKYADKIKVLLGIEQDYFSDAPTEGYDYIIGSVHYVKKDGVYLPVDESHEIQLRIVKEHYMGDFYAFCEDYFALVGDLYNKTKCDIVGHFDLIEKFNETGDLFDRSSPRYRAAADTALDKLLQTGVRFEVNFGAVACGYRSEPYPDSRLLEKLRAAHAKLVKTSDCHDKAKLLFGLQ